MDAQNGLQLDDLVGIIRRRGALLVRVAGACLLAVFWISMALPNQYRASSLILVEPQGVNDDLVAAGIRESDLGQRLGIMSSEILSRARLSKLITDLDLYPDMADWYTREEVVEHMRAGLSVSPVFSELESQERPNRDLEFNTFAVSFEYDSPVLAAEVVNRLASDFISEHISARVRVSQKSLEFMRASMDDLRQRIVVVDANIKQLKEQNPGTLPEDLVGNQRIQQQTLVDLRIATQALGAAQSDEAFWNNQVIAAVSLTAPNDRADPAYRRKEVKIQLKEMESRGYTERHPDILAARAEIAALEAALDVAAREDDENESGSYAEQNAKSELRRAKLRVEGGMTEVNRLQNQLGAVEARIAATPAVAEQLEGLIRESESIYSSYQDFGAKLQQASVQADMERRQLGEQLRILETAFAPPAPTSPNRPLIIALGLILGLALGGAVVVLVETADASVHGARELQAMLGIPVLADIPKIILESDRAARARRLVIESVVITAVVVTCLVGGLITYFVVNGPPSFLAPSDSEVVEGQGDAQAARSYFDVRSDHS